MRHPVHIYVPEKIKTKKMQSMRINHPLHAYYKQISLNQGMVTVFLGHCIDVLLISEYSEEFLAISLASKVRLVISFNASTMMK